MGNYHPRVEYRPGKFNDNADALSRLEMPEEDYLDANTCKLIMRALSGANDRVAVTEITSLPNFEELRRCQLSDQFIGKIIREMETVPTDLQFSGVEWKEYSILNRYKQI